MAATDLVTLAEAKEHLGIVDSESDSYLETLIERVTEWVEGYTDRLLVARAYTDLIVEGSGTPELRLPEWPVEAADITSIAFRFDLGTWADQSLTYLEVLDDTRTIVLLDNCFPRGRNVLVTYTGGYPADEIPERLKQGVLEVLTHKHKLKDRQMQSVSAVTFQGQTVSYSEGLPRETLVLLDWYRRPGF